MTHAFTVVGTFSAERGVEQADSCPWAGMQDNELGAAELEALVMAVYPQCLPSELRHLQVSAGMRATYHLFLQL